MREGHVCCPTGAAAVHKAVRLRTVQLSWWSITALPSIRSQNPFMMWPGAAALRDIHGISMFSHVRSGHTRVWYARVVAIVHVLAVGHRASAEE